MSKGSTKTLLILGGTGLVGSHLIQNALAHPLVRLVIAPTRRPVTLRERLLNPLVDFYELPPMEAWWKADAVLCALGTTRRKAGSNEKLHRVDHDYVIQAAALARLGGSAVFVFNSSMGADPNSRSFYLRTKGETEIDLAALGFSSLTHVRPSLLDGGARSDFRPAECLGLWLAKRLESVIPERYQAVRTSDVAATMIAAALDPKPGMQVIESEQIPRQACRVPFLPTVSNSRNAADQRVNP